MRKFPLFCILHIRGNRLSNGINTFNMEFEKPYAANKRKTTSGDE